MGRVRNLTNQVFGRLTVVERAENDKQKKARWKCLCDCGNIVVISSKHLCSNNTKSCGCLRQEMGYERGKKLCGKHNPRWIGDDVGYSGAHRRVAQARSRPMLCEWCGIGPTQELAFLGEKGGYSPDPEQYIWICHRCHMLMDKGNPEAEPLNRNRIDKIRELYGAGGTTHRKLAKLFKVGHATISDVINKDRAYRCL